MHFFRNRIFRSCSNWNFRALTEEDFYALCRKHKIVAEEMPLRTNGFYYSLLGKHYIVVDSRLSGHEKLFVMFHELAHFLLHVPDEGVTANFHGVGKRTRKESEADAFALCALIPKKWIETRLPAELIAEEGLPPEYVEQRTAIYQQYGM